LKKVNLNLGFTVDQLHRESEIHRVCTRELFGKTTDPNSQNEVLVGIACFALKL